MKYIFFLSILLAAAGCTMHPTVKVKIDSLSIVKKTPDTPVKVKADTPKIEDTTKTITPGYGFKIVQRIKLINYKNEDSRYLEKYLEIWHNHHKILTDTTDSAADYKLESKFYPILRQIKPELFEVVLSMDDRPSKDFAFLFRIEDDKLVNRVKIPDFDSKPEWINGMLTYHSAWGYSELFGEGGHMYITCDPQIYYKVTLDGLKLDTAVTTAKNIEKYGRFEGFTYKGTIGYRCDSRGNIIDTSAKSVLRRSDY